MSALHPDRVSAERLAEGLGGSRPLDPKTGDGTLIEDPSVQPPMIIGGHTFKSVTDTICGWTEKPQPKVWLPLFLIAGAVATMCTLMVVYLIITGVGVWGLTIPVGWGFDITNFVFWVGIGHAGTLISAILCIFKQKWRTSINRSAEAMTIFAVICAGMFPGIHVGRFWFVWMVFPIPNYNWIWPNFRSPLLWDVFAVSTYFTVSLLFWYMGMIPDLATLRDRAIKNITKRASLGGLISIPSGKIAAFAYGILSMGWRFSLRGWWNYEKAYILLAGMSTPLVLSVHSIVSFDFAVSVLPGWHTTIFPPYFVAGAIFSGFAMVLTLMIPMRSIYPRMKDFLTLRHIENMCKIITVTGSMVGFAYGMEFFIAWYGGNEYELYAFTNRAFGPYWWAYWTMVSCNVITPQLFWLKWCRTTPWFIFIVTIFVNIGMWFERFVIIVTSLHRDFLPSSWDMYTPTYVEVLTFIGSFGIFLSLFLLFLKFLPAMAISELKNVLPAADPHAEEGH
ncbi:polysulfide reductase NrfD [Geitlerinema splendidum]|nr:polysulfide reductase NrfD [Geitlerinema splendidum]